jgi:PAS domain S-box-containing protein
MDAIADQTPNAVAPPKRNRTAKRQCLTNRLRAIVEASIDSLITINAAGEIIDFNAAAERTFGYGREEVLGTPLAEAIVPPPFREAHRRGLAAFLESGQARILGKCLEVTAMRKDGSEIPVELTVVQIPNEDPPVFTAFIHDLTKRKANETALRQREEEYRLLFEVNPTPMYIFDTATLGFLAVNRAAIAQYGYSEAEFLSLTMRDIRPAEDFAHFRQVVRKIGDAGPSGQWRHLRRDGSLIFVSIYSSPITFNQRAARMVVAADVTQQREADEQVRQSEANLALAQRVARMGSWEVDLMDRENRAQHPPRWSDETLRIFGVEPGTKVTHESFFHLLHPDERQLARDTFIQQLRTGAPYRIDHRIIRRDGSERIVHVQSDTVRDDLGRLVKIAGTVQDLTEQREAERLLRQQARLLNLASDAISVRNLDGTVRMWNQGAERLYGWTAAEMSGRPVVDFIYQDKARYAEANSELLQRGEWRGELPQVCKDGRKITVSGRWTLVRDERGEPESVLVIHTDITEQKKLETQFLRSQRLESIGTLAAGVAHDLNNILAPILLVAPLLRGDTARAEEKETFLSLVQASAERGANLVKQMLTFARGADGERVLLQPSYLIEEVAKIAGQTFPKSITIRTKYPKDLWMIEGDPTQLQQVLLNLCVNARDAMPEGGTLRLTIENFEVDEHYASMTSGAKPGPHVLLHVSDQGHGIPRHVVEKIFDPFFTTKEVGHGTGLGLSTVLGIVKNYGGFMNVYSEPGHTSFRVFLPASNAATTTAVIPDSHAIANGRGEKILIVDDEPCIRTAAQRVLEGWGYQPLVAEDGVSALAIYAQQPNEIDLILTDLVMPLMDGLMLIRAVRKLNPEQKIILSTGRDEDLQSPEIRSLGVDACLTKPHSREKLLITLEETLRCDRAACA